MASSRGAVRFLLSACIFWTETQSWFIKLPTCLVNGVSDLYKLHCNNTDTVRLHCLLDDNNLAGITCTPWKWIYDGYCPYYNHDQQRIDQRLCPGNSSVCTSNVQGGKYPSYLVYKLQLFAHVSQAGNNLNSSQVSNVTSDKYGDAVPIDHTGNSNQVRNVTSDKCGDAVTLDHTGFLLSACIFWTETQSWFIKLPTCLVNGVSDLYKLHCNNTDTVRLHCLLDDNNLAGITCTPWKWIYDGYCPYYNHDQQRIDQRLCPGNSSVCPSNVQGGNYPSYLVYKYMACLGLRNSSQVRSVTSDKCGDAVTLDHTGNDAETITALAVVVDILLIVVLITTLTLIRIIHRSKREQPRSQLKNSYHVDI